MMYSTPEQVPKHIIQNLDVIIVLGGGVPDDPNSPPSYVKKRCDYASAVYHLASDTKKPNVLALSAGTAHLPQLISNDGLPVWESTATASYLIRKCKVDPTHVYVETTSYDTISNAFFTRTNFCDIAGWKNLLIITNDFHMERTKLIFDWIMKVPSTSTTSQEGYNLHYLSVPDDGLSKEALQVRKHKEAKSADTVKNILSKKYTTVQDVWIFLTREHSFYNAQQLVDRANTIVDDKRDQKFQALRLSYGGSSRIPSYASASSTCGSFMGGFFSGAVLTIIVLLLRNNRDVTKAHAK
jgi:uncharacterized SAM-binding protein YcdF (DUF218 family)